MIKMLEADKKVARLDAYGLAQRSDGLPGRHHLRRGEERPLPDAEEHLGQTVT